MLQVHGIKILMVVDTTVVPMSVSAHTQAFSYLVGERGARLILQDNADASFGECGDEDNKTETVNSEPADG